MSDIADLFNNGKSLTLEEIKAIGYPMIGPHVGGIIVQGP